MSKIRTLVDQLRLTPSETEEKYNQTAVLPLPSYYLLCGLAEYLRLPRNRLSGMLLSAAIEEAIAALPTEENNSADGQEFSSPAEYVRYLAWREKGLQETAEEYSANKKRQTVA
jgi:hypothetical protein